MAGPPLLCSRCLAYALPLLSRSRCHADALPLLSSLFFPCMLIFVMLSSSVCLVYPVPLSALRDPSFGLVWFSPDYPQSNNEGNLLTVFQNRICSCFWLLLVDIGPDPLCLCLPPPSRSVLPVPCSYPARPALLGATLSDPLCKCFFFL